jgi:hypothetical protein
MTATRERFGVEAERRKLGAMTAGELRRRHQQTGRLSLGGPGRSGGLADNTESRCLSLLVSPRNLSLVKSVRPNERPPDLLAEGLGNVTRRVRTRREDASC